MVEFNVLFITIDGGRIDRILNSNKFKNYINEGTAFSKIITYAPYTIAAMHAIFSGEYGFKNGVDSYWATYNFKKKQFKTITKYFQDNGYKTFGDAINKLILPTTGFDELLYHDEDKDNLVIRHKKMLEKMKKLTNNGEKFFLYLHYSNIHTNIKHNVLTKYNNFSTEYFKNKNENSKKYDNYFSQAENYLVEILEHCTKLDLKKNTLIVIISDHGISVGEKMGERAYGVYCYDYTIKSFALLIKDGIFPNKIISQQVRSIDIMPTILEAVGITQDNNYENISGKSLFPIIQGGKETRTAIIESGNPLDTNKPPEKPNVLAIRKNDWKLIVNLHDSSRELYNLQKDPLEEENVYQKENQIAKDLFNELSEIRNIE